MITLVLKAWKVPWALLLYYFMSDEEKTLVREDLASYIEKSGDVYDYSGFIHQLLFYLLNVPTFRSVFYFRGEKHRILKTVSSIFLPSIDSIEIYGDFGGGLYIAHNFTTLAAENCGKNLDVKPGVVIGRVGDSFPVIGDNVMIGANAVIVGNIKVGNNVIIGAGSVVVHDIPDNSVVVGNPARVIKQRTDIRKP